MRLAVSPSETSKETRLLLSQLILFGVSMGCLYALIAIGFVMIWNTAAVVNFAQGEFAMFGMFLNGA